MRLQDYLMKVPDHAEYINVGINDHHDQPSHIETSNTSLVVQPLPGGPGVWLINLTNNATVIMFTFRSNHLTWQGTAHAGVIGIATTNQLRTSAMTWGGHGTQTTTSYNMVYTKAAAALNLSDKIFSSGGADISLTECYIVTGTPNQLRTEWTNYSAGLRTLNVWCEISILG